MNPIGFEKLELGTDSDQSEGKYVLRLELDVPKNSEVLETGALYFRPYYYGEFCPFIHKLALNDEKGDRFSANWKSRFPYMRDELRRLGHENRGRGGSRGRGGNSGGYPEAMMKYWSSYADHIGQADPFDDDMIQWGIDNQQFIGVSHVTLNPKNSGSGQQPSRLRSDTSWANEINEVHLEIGTRFPPLLLGIPPEIDWGSSSNHNYLEWPSDTAVEVTYVPPELESHIQEGNVFVNEELNLSEFPALSREIQQLSEFSIQALSPPDEWKGK
jgi:hypothetical protein